MGRNRTNPGRGDGPVSARTGTVELIVTEVEFVPARGRHRENGCLGVLTFLFNGRLRVLDATLRRNRDGRVFVALPWALDRRGRRREYLVPVDHEARSDIERQILTAVPAEFLR